MQRFRNYGLWVSVAAFIPLFLKGIGYDILPSNYNDIVNSLLSILVVAGFLNNPSIGTGYSDTVKPTSPKDITNDVKQ